MLPSTCPPRSLSTFNICQWSRTLSLGKFVQTYSQGWAARQIACELQTWLKFIQVSKKLFFGFSLHVYSQLILKYAYTLDILIPHIVHMTYFDYTLSILQNNVIAENFNEVHWHILFSQSFEELAKCGQNMLCGQCEVSKHLTYRHILKSIMKKLEKKNQKFTFSKLDLSLSVHMQSAVLLPPDSGCWSARQHFHDVI